MYYIVNSYAKATHKSHKLWSPINNDDSTVVYICPKNKC